MFFSFSINSMKYICGLTLIDKTKLIDSGRKTGFIGIMACLNNIEVIYRRFVASNILNFFPFYKINKSRPH